MKKSYQCILMSGLVAVSSLSAEDATPTDFSEDIIVLEEDLSLPAETPEGRPGAHNIATPSQMMGMDGAAVVDVPRAPVEGASRSSSEDTIPVIERSLPADTVVQLQASPVHQSSVASMSEQETISVDFPDEDVRTILRNVADLFDLNLVIPETLQGRTSLKLRNVTWPQVFEVVLDPLGFTHVQDRNIIRVRAKSELAQEAVDTRVFIVNYARAADLTGSIQPLIDSAVGGRIQVDRRTNALVITERPSRMPRILDIINRLDRPTQQVMIQSKFVEVRYSDGKDLGVSWSSLGAEGGVDVGVGPFATRLSTSDTPLNIAQQPIVGNIPVPNNPLDTAVFNMATFNSVLRALQTQNDVRLVTNPTVVTMDGERAEIKITREFPQPDFTFNAQTGQRQFNGLGAPIDVGITLEVTPSVNADGFITLDVFPEVSSTQEDRQIEGTAFPIRDVRTARTRITIKDGFTLALGGLVDQSITNQESRVPVLGNIPGVGRLFRSNSESKEETNLIIFITARTLNPDGTTYEEIIDPRQIERMRLTEGDIPGYQVSAEELERLRSIRALRSEDENAARALSQQMTREEIESARLSALEAEGDEDTGPRRVVRGELR